MPEYLSPGVYVEEIAVGPRPIAGVSTSTAGLVGVTARGPSTGKPVLVTNFLDFQTTFGGFLPTPDPGLADSWQLNPTEGGRWWLFPLAVKGFFDNGGQILYVKRVVSAGAVTASAAVAGGLTSEVTGDAAVGATSLAVRHLVGITGTGQTVTVVRGDTGASSAVTLAGYSATGPRLELAAPLAQEVRAARGDFVRYSQPGDAGPLSFATVSPGGWGNAVSVRARPVVTATLPLLSETSEGRPFVSRIAVDVDADADTVPVAPAAGLPDPDLPADLWVSIMDSRYRVSVGQPDSDGRIPLILPQGTTHPAWPAGTTVQRVRRVDTTAPRVSGVARLYPNAVVQLDTRTAMTLHKVVAVSGDTVTLDPAGPDALFETDRLYLVEGEVAASYPSAPSEVLGNLRLTADDPTGLVAAVANRSQLVRATAADGLLADPLAYLNALGGALSTLDGGDDGLADLSVADFVGLDGGSGARTGIVALEDIDEVAICAVPGMWSGTVQSALITHCEFLADRFGILDPPPDAGVDEVLSFREAYDTSYAALYHPWLVTTDPSTGLDTEVPPAGHLAGIYARVDSDRGVHKAPANVAIRGIRTTGGIAQDINKRQQDVLNPRGINALRTFPDLGARVWGARTLSSDPQWRYINVRRLFLYLEESIDQGTQWAVFEPNGEPLWALIRQTVGNFLGTVWRSGALAGTTPDEAFTVTCDRTTMTEDDLQNGRLICVVAAAPVYPAEFVIFRIQQKTQEALLT